MNVYKHIGTEPVELLGVGIVKPGETIETERVIVNVNFEKVSVKKAEAKPINRSEK